MKTNVLIDYFETLTMGDRLVLASVIIPRDIGDRTRTLAVMAVKLC